MKAGLFFLIVVKWHINATRHVDAANILSIQEETRRHEILQLNGEYDEIAPVTLPPSFIQF